MFEFFSTVKFSKQFHIIQFQNALDAVKFDRKLRAFIIKSDVPGMCN